MSRLVDTPARRRRHARTISTATQLIEECAAAAGDVFHPIADALSSEVPVTLQRIVLLAAAASARLDAAAAEDTRVWRAQAVREADAVKAAFHSRCVTAEAETALASTQQQETLPELEPEQTAAIQLVETTTHFADVYTEAPDEAMAELRDLAATGEYIVAEVLDEAMRTELAAACTALRNAAQLRDPSSAAECVLQATRHLAQAVTFASLDP